MRQKNPPESISFQTDDYMQDYIINELKLRGFKITKQRKIIIETILKTNCNCSKEIYYQVVKKDASIGIATVYRVLKMLEEIGVFDRKTVFHSIYDKLIDTLKDQVLFIDEENITQLQAGNWYHSMKQTLKEQGLIDDHQIAIVIKKSVLSMKEDSYD